MGQLGLNALISKLRDIQNDKDREYLKGTLFEKIMNAVEPSPEFPRYDKSFLLQPGYSQMVTEIIEQDGGKQKGKRRLDIRNIKLKGQMS